MRTEDRVDQTAKLRLDFARLVAWSESKTAKFLSVSTLAMVVDFRVPTGRSKMPDSHSADVAAHCSITSEVHPSAILHFSDRKHTPATH